VSAEERTSWRDERMSQRHRGWGLHCPAVDLDLVLCEYDGGRPVALVEYKHRDARLDLTHRSYQALRALGQTLSGELPVLVASYCAEDWWVIVYPLNAAAEAHYPTHARRLSEQEWVRSLWALRGRRADAATLAPLGTRRPPATRPQEVRCA
jgi:hypothetical protein